MPPTILYGDYEWDLVKADANIREHHVSFEEAATVFVHSDVVIDTDGSGTETLKAIGLSVRGRLLTVIHESSAVRDRIISAWRSSRHETNVYLNRGI